ncbi:MAG: prolyl oligopeptidase family serine peptidase, partial [Armatimonadetes bacterium]|nr:prolyl oligopeptidase family serine peptidase [Armatimonadota bacterium]
MSAQSADRLYELMRPLWQPQPKNFLREWLVCGEFPFPPHAGQKFYDHTPPCAGFDTDYLKEHGGERSIHPTDGMRHTRPDGTVTEWRQYKSDQDIIDLNKVFAGRPPENAVAYAFTTLTMAQPTRQFLAVGSDDGIRLWLNGKLIHDHLVARGAAPDQDFVLADFKQGENTVLLKIENGAGLWGFCFRLVEESSLAGDTRPYEPKIESPVGDPLLCIRPDKAVALGPGQTMITKVEVVAPGGSTVARAEISGCRDLILPTDEWPEGPYEVRCEMDLGFGNRRVKHLPWFKGDPKCAVAWLVDSLRDANLHTSEGMVHSLLVDLVRDRLGGNPGTVDNSKVLSVHSELMEFSELREDRGEGKGSVHPYGFVRLAYRDEIDDSPQFCRAYLPPDYDATRSWPLVINLHGRNPDNPPYTKWENVDLRHHPWAEQYKAIVLEPHGRYNSWYKGLGVRDVLRCLELARQRFRVDEDRVYLTGASMGGGGVWEIGARYPELFAALAPVYGGWDDRIFVDNGALDRLTPRQRFEAQAYSSFSRAESLLTTPVFVNHGTRDEFVDVNHARLAVGTLQRWGYEVEYWEHVDKGHDPSQLGHERTMLSWLLKHRRVRAPRHVRVRAADLKSAAAHWVRVESSENPLSFIQVDADLVAPNFVRLNTDNVLAITLSPGPELADPALPLKVDWNGRGTPPTRLVQGKATLYAPGSSPGERAKRPELAGPLRELQTMPFAIIVGTTSRDPRMRDFCARQANRIADEWQEQQHW